MGGRHEWYCRISADRRSLRLFGANYGISPVKISFLGEATKGGTAVFISVAWTGTSISSRRIVKESPIAPLLNFAAFRVHNRTIT
ncbi:hypothetical protein, partial [Salmonirosea aquatica]|uniref:hypothetical protein n=1 Tax=Salmonirosea aquatica TaxID=2654236 RepID=UPI00357141A1